MSNFKKCVCTILNRGRYKDCDAESFNQRETNLTSMFGS